MNTRRRQLLLRQRGRLTCQSLEMTDGAGTDSEAQISGNDVSRDSTAGRLPRIQPMEHTAQLLASEVYHLMRRQTQPYKVISCPR